jgi:cytochrome c oxidase cbb3-type subunit 4
MDLDTLRSAVTLLSFLVFAGIVAWALSPRKKAAFAEAELLPFLDAAEAEGTAARRPHATGSVR